MSIGLVYPILMKQHNSYKSTKKYVTKLHKCVHTYIPLIHITLLFEVISYQLLRRPTYKCIVVLKCFEETIILCQAQLT